ncbi:fibrinogen C domain-containing protein 1-A-like [Panulirus ornatus]|uniref:fibrinogen C domain-containing protein 1-A-like n=1 Tax=Panulirus ornatus TaxID=150431 RepID=UPI003A8B3FE8
MRAILGIFCLLVLMGDSIYGARTSPMSELKSRMIFKQELDKMAYDFQAKLREELSFLESDIYSEFLSFVQEVEMSQDSLSDALRVKLAEQVAEVLQKFTKVMTYSTVKIQDLHGELNALLMSLGGWPEEVHSGVLFYPDEYFTATLYNNEVVESERNRRHALDWLPADPQPYYHDHFATTSDSDPLALPLQVTVDMSVFMDSDDYLDDRLEGESSQFVLRDYTPGLGSKASRRETHHSHGAAAGNSLPKDCLDVLTAGRTQDGVYTIYPSGVVGVEVWCDQTSAGGGWTVVVGRRADHPQVNFTGLPLHYTRGFGHPATQHWIGLDHLEALTRGNQNTTLRVHLLDDMLNPAHATYTVFSVAGAEEHHRLEVGGYDPSSTAGDALTPHSGMPFSFPDTSSDGECGDDLGVGWWFLASPNCYLTLPTGRYHPPGQYQGTGGVEWQPWRGQGYSLHTLLFMTRRSRE